MMIYIVVKLMVAAEHTMMMAVMVVNVWWGDWTLLHTYALFDGTNVDISMWLLFVVYRLVL